jgi:hypothetical protein
MKILFISVIYYANVWQLTKAVMPIKTNLNVTLQGKLLNGLPPTYQLIYMIYSSSRLTARGVTLFTIFKNT